MEDDTVMVFKNPSQVQASVNANTFVVAGPHEKKKASEVESSGMNLAELQRLVESAKGSTAGATTAGAADSTDDLPELVEDFEKFSQLD